jgi:hypothetical protein
MEGVKCKGMQGFQGFFNKFPIESCLKSIESVAKGCILQRKPFFKQVPRRVPRSVGKVSKNIKKKRKKSCVKSSYN